jgi:hypothetical protein
MQENPILQQIQINKTWHEKVEKKIVLIFS